MIFGQTFLVEHIVEQQVCLTMLLCHQSGNRLVEKNAVIPWLDHGTQVMKSAFYKEDTITWAPWSSHGVTEKRK